MHLKCVCSGRGGGGGGGGRGGGGGGGASGEGGGRKEHYRMYPPMLESFKNKSRVSSKKSRVSYLKNFSLKPGRN